MGNSGRGPAPSHMPPPHAPAPTQQRDPWWQWAGADPANYGNGRHGCAPIALVNHVMLGTLGGTRQEFANPNAQVSAHFGIGQDGTIVQFVHLSDAAWANGPIRQPNVTDVPWIRDRCMANHINPNWLTISLEWEGTHGGMQWSRVRYDGALLDTAVASSMIKWWTPAPAQWAAGITLARWLVTRCGIAVDRAHICRHSDFDSITKWFCPGEGFPLAKMITELSTTGG